MRLPRVNTGALNIIPVSLKQLQGILFSMPNKNSGVDGDIPVNILKICFQAIGKVLLQIINTSFVTETVPSAWKRAVIIPIYKKGNPSEASNFRPITIVPTICKIVEKLVHHQITSYLTHYSMFSSEQHGFMEKHSTCTALLSITDEILLGMDQSKVTLLSLIDLHGLSKKYRDYRNISRKGRATLIKFGVHLEGTLPDIHARALSCASTQSAMAYL